MRLASDQLRSVTFLERSPRRIRRTGRGEVTGSGLSRAEVFACKSGETVSLPTREPIARPPVAVRGIPLKAGASSIQPVVLLGSDPTLREQRIEDRNS